MGDYIDISDLKYEGNKGAVLKSFEYNPEYARTLDTINDIIREQYNVDISRSTVYRHLQDLIEEGAVLRQRVGKKDYYYVR